MNEKSPDNILFMAQVIIENPTQKWPATSSVSFLIFFNKVFNLRL